MNAQMLRLQPEHISTNVKNVFTAGDMHRGQSLVGVASVKGARLQKL